MILDYGKDYYDDIHIAQLHTLRIGLKCELKTGMQMSRGKSCYQIIKKRWGLKGNKKSVLEQFTRAMKECCLIEGDEDAKSKTND